MKSIQRVALQEPLVDLVEARQVTTGPCLVKVSYSSSCCGYQFWLIGGGFVYSRGERLVVHFTISTSGIT